MSATRPLHLAAEIGGPPRYDARSHIALARLAEGGALDFVTLNDSFARPGPDALAVLAHVAPATTRIGLVPTVTTTHTEPFHVSSAVATLDWVSKGRAGWQADVSTTEAEARLFGRRPAAPASTLWQEAGRPPTPERGCGTAGRTARRSGTWPPAASSTATNSTTSTSRAAPSPSEARPSCRGRRRAGPSPSSTPRAARPARRPHGTPTSPTYGPRHPNRPPRSATSCAAPPRPTAVTPTACGSWPPSPSTSGTPRPPRTRTRERPSTRRAGDLLPGRPCGPRRGHHTVAPGRGRGRLPPHPHHTGARPGEDRQRDRGAAPAPESVPHLPPGRHAPGAPRPRPPRQPLHAHEHLRGDVMKQMHLAAHFPGVNSTTVWADPRSRSQIDFTSFEHLARTAERGSSTSSSSRRGCGCASTTAASTTSTWSAAPNPSPSSTPWQPSPNASGSPPRSTRPSTSRTNSPAASPRSTTSARAAPRGTW